MATASESAHAGGRGLHPRKWATVLGPCLILPLCPSVRASLGSAEGGCLSPVNSSQSGPIIGPGCPGSSRPHPSLSLKSRGLLASLRVGAKDCIHRAEAWCSLLLRPWIATQFTLASPCQGWEIKRPDHLAHYRHQRNQAFPEPVCVPCWDSDTKGASAPGWTGAGSLVWRSNHKVVCVSLSSA